jgi:release factor glutamine methyltransferase
MPSLLSDITSSLDPVSDTPALDASVLLAHILHKPRTWVLAHPELILTNEQQHELNEALALLESGEPFPYVIGHWEFFGLDFEITPDVLIPRPETELLVERAIAWLQGSSDRRLVADVGTGSGAIAISIALNVQHVNILATDVSEGALAVAKRNSQKHGVSDRIQFAQCDLLPDTTTDLNLIGANLPYIPTETLHDLPIYGREPTLALDGGEDGLHLIQRLLEHATESLAPQALMLLEIEATRGPQALILARELFPRAQIQVHRDLRGKDRLLEISLE